MFFPEFLSPFLEPKSLGEFSPKVGTIYLGNAIFFFPHKFSGKNTKKLKNNHQSSLGNRIPMPFFRARCLCPSDSCITRGDPNAYMALQSPVRTIIPAQKVEESESRCTELVVGQNKYSGKGALVRRVTSSSTDQGLFCSKRSFLLKAKKHPASSKDNLGRQHRNGRNPARMNPSLQLMDLLPLEGV